MISGFTFLVGISDLHNACKTLCTHTQEKTKSMKLKSVICVPLTGLKGIEKIMVSGFHAGLPNTHTTPFYVFHYLVPLQTLVKTA